MWPTHTKIYYMFKKNNLHECTCEVQKLPVTSKMYVPSKVQFTVIYIVFHGHFNVYVLSMVPLFYMYQMNSTYLRTLIRCRFEIKKIKIMYPGF